MAKKKEQTDIVPVLPGQVSIEQQIAEQAHTISGNVYEIDIQSIQPHPQNTMFDTTPQEMKELYDSIDQFGMLQTGIVNRRADGTLRMVAGHRRRETLIALGYTTMRCEIVQVDDDAELVMLFHNNLGRGLKEHFKIRFFKVVKQFLRQFRQGIENTGSYENDDIANTLFVQSITKHGDMRGKRTWEIIELITGFSRHEQDVLTHVCDEDYRNTILNKVEDKAKRTRLLRHWQNLEDKALNGEISLVFLHNEVKNLVKLLEAKALGKGKGKQPSLPKAPVLKNNDHNKVIQKYIQAHAGMWAGRIIELQNAEENQIMPCIISILDEFITYQEKLKR